MEYEEMIYNGAIKLLAAQKDILNANNTGEWIEEAVSVAVKTYENIHHKIYHEEGKYK